MRDGSMRMSAKKLSEEQYKSDHSGLDSSHSLLSLIHSERPLFQYAHTTWGMTTLGMAAITALAAIVSVWLKKDRAALICTVGEVTLILWGWALAQYPYLVTPDVTIADSAPPATLTLVLVALLAGACALFPSLYYLYRIFKGATIMRVLE